ncbi:hypothetical protein [McMurdo Ice Shelf pond-associated circular DNA virus-6]|uniref:hypothetical protein n=1 Tax=McMurdo Ice Shelf pond-associated circular DNA virus-6 TaxID=1521390 RepID=UPI0004D12BA2|nr:hypothetical protein [McMurdo Ice Shelf pond-associated circular DNA virus-6]AIF71516.1 hypothetical protein [McMurdo Ice Shelf pond-associated circular DNA virus-6]
MDGQEACEEVLSSSGEEQDSNPVDVWDEVSGEWKHHPRAEKRPMGSDEEILDNASKFFQSFKESLMCHEVWAQPDLAEYFANFEISEFTQISLCRTYANYLAQVMRARNAGTPSEGQSPPGGANSLRVGHTSTRKIKRKLF